MAFSGGYSPRGWVNDSGPPFVGATALGQMDAGIASGQHYTCLFADLTNTSAAARPGALAFTTDSGGVYLSDGTQWTLVAQRSFAVNLSAASSYDFVGLDGDHAGGYIIEYVGHYDLPGSLNCVINVKPNGSSADAFRTSLVYHATSNGGGDSSGLDSTDYGGVGVGLTIATSNYNLSGQVAGRATLHSRSGTYRVCDATQAWSDAAATPARVAAQWVSKWEQAATAITDLTIDFGGATFTGVFRLTPMMG